MQPNSIHHLYVPYFPVTLERLRHSELRTKAFALAMPHSDRAQILAVSSEAARAGIHIGMPVSMARQMEPRLLLLPPAPDYYHSAQRALERFVAQQVPTWESAGQGKIYLASKENHAQQSHHREPWDSSDHWQKMILQQFSLKSAVGHASNKLLSLAASEQAFHCSQDLLMVVPRENESEFLAPFPSSILPPFQSEHVEGKGLYTHSMYRHSPARDTLLQELNLHTVADIRRLPLHFLEAAFPLIATDLYQYSRGIDSRPVCPTNQERTIEAERYLSKGLGPESETNNTTLIIEYGHQLLDSAFRQLHEYGNGQIYAGAITLSLRYSDFVWAEKTISFNPPVCYAESVRTKAAHQWRALHHRRTSVSYICVQLSELTSSSIQLSLPLSPSTPRKDT